MLEQVWAPEFQWREIGELQRTKTFCVIGLNFLQQFVDGPLKGVVVGRTNTFGQAMYCVPFIGTFPGHLPEKMNK